MATMDAERTTVEWNGDCVELIEQTLLPDRYEVLQVRDVPTMIDAIKRLAVRGAPAIGVAGGYGVALAARTLAGSELTAAVDAIRHARPTAVNLARMVDRTAARIPEGAEAVLQEAHAIRQEELDASVAQGRNGADLIAELCGDRPVRVMTICNTGGLATVARGTALAVVQELFERGRLVEAIALETRPLLQGARLTAWELHRMGAPHRLIVDSAAPFLLSRGVADVVLIGADRIAANGDTANKVGSFSLALGAKFAGVPFIVVAPESTVDPATATGADIEIEDRGAAEVVTFRGHPTSPPGTNAINPAFDVTPVELITALVTDQRVVRYRDAAGA
jgi:methylthioribose-1-phosphate isomerase